MAGFEHLREKKTWAFFYGKSSNPLGDLSLPAVCNKGYVPTPIYHKHARQLSGLPPYNQSGQASNHAALQIGIPMSELGPATSFNHCKPKE